MSYFKVYSVEQLHALNWEIRLNACNAKGEILYGGDSISWYSAKQPKHVIAGDIYEIGLERCVPDEDEI